MSARRHVLASALVAIACGWLGPGWLAAAQETVVGKVVAGERGYELPVDVANRGAEPIEDVTVSVRQLPEGLVNVSVTPRRVATLPAGQTARFVVRFDVARDAAPRDAAVLAFVVSARNVEFDVPDPSVAVAVIARPGAPGQPPGQVAPAAGRLVYVLTGVDAQSWVDHTPKQLGYAIRQTTAGGKTSIEAVWCVDCPGEIVPGEPVHIEVRSRKRFDYPNYSCWFDADGKGMEVGEAPVSVGIAFLQPAVFAAGGRLIYPSCETLGIKEEHVTRKVEGQVTVQGARKATAAVTLEDSVSLTADYRPTRTEVRDATHQRFHYAASFGSSGALSRSRSDVHHDVSYRTTLRRVEDVWPAAIAIEVGAMTLRYTLVVGGTPAPLPVAAFTLPGEFNRPPLGGSRVAGGAAGSGDGTSSTASPPSEAGGGTQPGAPPGSGTRSTRPLHEADIAPLVREWLTAAEPPVNARGGSAQYDEWGRVVGQVPGGMITAGARPDDVEGRTPIQYVWDKRDQLDSLRHCTLGTYVTRRLAGQSIADCARAGGPPTAEAFNPGDLVGRRLREAVGLVAAAGLSARPEVGPPAPAPRLEGTIASASRQGQDVVLEVYTAAADAAARVPDVVGQRLGEAKAALEAAGLRIDPVLEAVAPTPGQTGRVHRQEPAPPAEVARGAAVRVWVYGQPESPDPAAGACDLTGTWTNRTNVTTTWTFSPAAPGSTTYLAEERGGCEARGTATVMGHAARLEWSCRTGFAGTYQWNFDAPCGKGTGSVTHSGPSLRGQRFASTITRVGPPPTAGDGGRGNGKTGPRPESSVAERRLGPESLRFPAAIAGERLNAPHPRDVPGHPELDSSGVVARPARGWLSATTGTSFQVASYGSTIHRSIRSSLTVAVYWSPGPGQPCARPRFEAGSRTLSTPTGPAPSSFYWVSLHPEGRTAHAFLGQVGLSLEQLRRKIPEDTARRLLGGLLEQVAPYAEPCP